MTTKNDDRKNVSEPELVAKAEAGLSGQGAVVEAMLRGSEQSTKAAERARRQSWIAIAIALAALVLSLVALIKNS